MREAQVQTQIRNALQKCGWMVVKIVQCSAPGFPDLLALKDSRAVFIEVKQPGRKPRPLQEYRHRQLQGQGFEVIVATNKTDITHLL